MRQALSSSVQSNAGAGIKQLADIYQEGIAVVHLAVWVAISIHTFWSMQANFIHFTCSVGQGHFERGTENIIHPVLSALLSCIHLHIHIPGILELALCQEGGAQPEVEVQGAGGGACPQGSLVLLGGLAGPPCCPVQVPQNDAWPHILWVSCSGSFLGSFQSPCTSVIAYNTGTGLWHCASLALWIV